MLRLKKMEIFLKLQKRATLNNGFPGIPTMETFCTYLKEQKII